MSRFRRDGRANYVVITADCQVCNNNAKPTGRSNHGRQMFVKCCQGKSGGEVPVELLAPGIISPTRDLSSVQTLPICCKNSISMHTGIDYTLRQTADFQIQLQERVCKYSWNASA